MRVATGAAALWISVTACKVTPVSSAVASAEAAAASAGAASSSAVSARKDAVAAASSAADAEKLAAAAEVDATRASEVLKQMQATPGVVTNPPSACRATLELTQTALLRQDAAPDIAVVTRADMLAKLRPYVRLHGRDCTPETTPIRVCVATSAAAVKDCASYATPAAREVAYPVALSVQEILQSTQSDRLKEFQEHVYEATYFDIMLYYAVDASSAWSPTTAAVVSTVEVDTVRVVAAYEHETVSLSLVTLPGRLMLANPPCHEAQAATGGATPQACADGRGRWNGMIAASTLGAKLYVAPFVRFPFIGLSVAASTASLGLQKQLDASTPTDSVPGVKPLYTSPFDITANVIDFRVPKPMRLDIALGVGASLVKDSASDALRWMPQYGVSFSTPIVDLFGTPLGHKKEVIVDHRQDAATAIEISGTLQDLDVVKEALDGPAKAAPTALHVNMTETRDPPRNS
jgi:hypothetical protein